MNLPPKNLMRPNRGVVLFLSRIYFSLSCRLQSEGNKAFDDKSRGLKAQENLNMKYVVYANLKRTDRIKCEVEAESVDQAREIVEAIEFNNFEKIDTYVALEVESGSINVCELKEQTIQVEKEVE